jgi:fucose 4-O-acetylase-like acetyltransferase
MRAWQGEKFNYQNSGREIWVDNIKVIACILVVLGHFLQSMTKAGILTANELYKWFIKTIYYFHVPLFFICSGYLYQKQSQLIDAFSWGRNVLKKAISLGIPYFTFSFATWLLKTVFFGAINSQVGGLVDTLFIHPISPYWFLYALFFIFLVTPTFVNKKMAVAGLTLATVLKVIGIIWKSCGVEAISFILSNEIWFVIGMCLSVFKFKKKIVEKNIAVPLILWNAFLALSVMVYKTGNDSGFISFMLGLLACFSIIMIIIQIYKDRNQSMLFGIFAKYTMAIFLMHTLFAAPIRIILLKGNIYNVAVHVFLGIIISFGGPMIVGCIMKTSRWLEFLIYPGKVIKIR